ncbi:MAG: SDR family oxidoreductase [Gammaproteobacteria bacterium]|nr:SDR family oxidoreductase [Gammaproteobacteria bacterium]MBT8150649.1 SDR family oxidoreductase [Gammaproteobacteria bacterium]NNM11958.1 SDR family oxidoreductase [Pseudomonadales bacterium]
MKGIQFDYSGANVLVTGGSNGIGLACAKAYQAAGASVAITGRKANAGEYEHDMGGLDYHQVDVAVRDELLALAKKFNALDILVNNAGGSQPDEWGHDGFDQSLDVNLKSAFHLSTACKPLLEASEFEGGASVIGIASMTSYFGFSWTPGYGPAKAGLVGMIKTLGQSWGESGIRANAVAAGLTRTNLTSGVIDAMPELAEESFARQGIKRLGVPEDIAAAVLFLTSPAASWITGQTLPVDGGFTSGM